MSSRVNGLSLPQAPMELPLPGRPRFAAADGAPTPLAPAPPAPTRRMKVLVVEDNADYRNIVSLLLRGDGLDVVEAGDGREGLRQAMRHRPDLVILDFNMPLMNGFELLRELRALDETRRISIILFTGSPQRRHLREMDLNVFAFLDKPVPNKLLLEHVRSALAPLSFEQVEPAAPTPPVPAPAPVAPAPKVAAATPAPAALATAPEPLTLPPLPSYAAEPAPVSPSPSAPAPAPAAPAPSLPPMLSALPEPDELIDSAELLETPDEVQEQKRMERERGIEAVADDSPLVKRVHQLLVQAVGRRASDIHIEPREDCVAVRFRIDGALVEICSLPASIHPRLTTRLKIMANLVITEHRVPQDGQFQARIRGKKVEFRVSTLPSAFGEKIVLRALASGGLSPDLGRLCMAPRDLAVVERTLKSPHGLILVTGPTGSGKTSTLYSMLAAVNKPDINILTAEDPIEYRLPGITQVQIRPAVGLKFDTVLRAFLRQDPDVMLVGEIRDLETADIAVKASITGHLVMSTLHTNSAPASVARLVHMGVPPSSSRPARG